MSAIQELGKPGAMHQTTGLRSENEMNLARHDEANHGHESHFEKPSTTLSGAAMLSVIVLVPALFGGLFVAGWIPRAHNAEHLQAESTRIKNAHPAVRITKPSRSAALTTVTLPGDVQALEETTIYPRTNGYVKQWLVDIGDEVTEGQLLAEIDVPEVRAQLQQSEAALLESEANLERSKATVNLAKLTTNRLRGLVATKNTAQQELDDSENNLAVAEANVRLGIATIEASKANVLHIRELLSFAEIHAPFTGTVVSRGLETGKLVSAGNGTGQALYRIARTDPVRVFIDVPQIYAPGVVKEMKAQIVAREMPDRVFEGVVTRTARAIDPLTRTLLTEIQVTNKDRALLTGSYVHVRMEVERQNPPLLIPASALVFNSQGTQVAVVGADNKIDLRLVDVAGDFGSQIGVSSGISADDQIVINPGDRLAQGMEVEIETDPPAKATLAKSH